MIKEICRWKVYQIETLNMSFDVLLKSWSIARIQACPRFTSPRPRKTESWISLIVRIFRYFEISDRSWRFNISVRLLPKAFLVLYDRDVCSHQIRAYKRTWYLLKKKTIAFRDISNKSRLTETNKTERCRTADKVDYFSHRFIMGTGN